MLCCLWGEGVSLDDLSCAFAGILFLEVLLKLYGLGLETNLDQAKNQGKSPFKEAKARSNIPLHMLHGY